VTLGVSSTEESAKPTSPSCPAGAIAGLVDFPAQNHATLGIRPGSSSEEDRSFSCAQPRRRGPGKSGWAQTQTIPFQLRRLRAPPNTYPLCLLNRQPAARSARRMAGGNEPSRPDFPVIASSLPVPPPVGTAPQRDSGYLLLDDGNGPRRPGQVDGTAPSSVRPIPGGSAPSLVRLQQSPRWTVRANRSGQASVRTHRVQPQAVIRAVYVQVLKAPRVYAGEADSALRRFKL